MIIQNAKIIYPDRIESGNVRIENGKITGFPEKAASGEEILEAEGLYLSPGFIDVHIHGAGGKDTMEGTEEALTTIGKAIAAHGTTSFVPTTMTQDIPSIRKVVEQVHAMKHTAYEGAQILGVHLEGPFINPNKLGAQNPIYVLEPSVEALQQMMQGYEEDIITVTLAPEMLKSWNLVQYLNENHIHASMGHTCADYETAAEAIQKGFTHATHLYNAMTPFQHRAPGVVGAVFDTDITTEMIADGIHIDYAALRIALKQKSIDKILLITDAMRGCTMPEGEYDLGGQTVWIRNGMAKLADGTFAGTLLTLDEAIRQLKDHTNYPLHEIVKMATWNPAVYCSLEHRKGKIAEGYDADLVLFDDKIRVANVIIGGKIFRG